MTEGDLDRIEAALNLALPSSYRSAMLEYPFSASSFAQDCEMPNDADRIIFKNRELLQQGFFGQPWHPSFFCFGGDGCGNEYYLDLSLDPSPVFIADHESSEFSKISSNLEEWIAATKSQHSVWAEQERLREARRRSAKWWMFWR
ncbi:MAG: SMI1/KNR4 family protein [Bdellovibrionales bacterium]|nr:SMI1/KNR4 family protein [Bdellovibrionales bacterium]